MRRWRVIDSIATAASSLLVGDRGSDIQAGRSAGVGRCWLVRSGVALERADIELADGVFDDLAACAASVVPAPP
jgi:D-glycero-D-manno-heptose 1,7-bisphosphate phosphatase